MNNIGLTCIIQFQCTFRETYTDEEFNDQSFILRFLDSFLDSKLQEICHGGGRSELGPDRLERGYEIVAARVARSLPRAKRADLARVTLLFRVCSSSMPVTIRPSNTRPDSPVPRNENHKFSLAEYRAIVARSSVKIGSAAGIGRAKPVFHRLEELRRFRMRGESEDNSHRLLWTFNDENIVTTSIVTIAILL